MKILVSACLLGENCKYNGGNNYDENLMKVIQGHEIIPICPEVMGGLTTPRIPAEIVDGKVMTNSGECVDKEFRKGASLALDIAADNKPDLIILQSRSPSCGVNEIYDGTFTGKKIKGSGIFAELLTKNGYKIIDIEDIFTLTESFF